MTPDPSLVAAAALAPDSLPDDPCPIPAPGEEFTEMLPDGGWTVRVTSEGSWIKGVAPGPYGGNHNAICDQSLATTFPGRYPFVCTRETDHPADWHVAVGSGVVAVWRVVAAQLPAEAASPLDDRPTVGTSEATS